MPHSYDEARDMQEQIEQHQSDKIDPAFIKLAKAVQSFTRQALKFYSDDVLNMYEDFADNFEEEQDNYPIIDFSMYHLI